MVRPCCKGGAFLSNISTVARLLMHVKKIAPSESSAPIKKLTVEEIVDLCSELECMPTTDAFRCRVFAVGSAVLSPEEACVGQWQELLLSINAALKILFDDQLKSVMGVDDFSFFFEVLRLFEKASHDEKTISGILKKLAVAKRTRLAAVTSGLLTSFEEKLGALEKIVSVLPPGCTWDDARDNMVKCPVERALLCDRVLRVLYHACKVDSLCDKKSKASTFALVAEALRYFRAAKVSAFEWFTANVDIVPEEERAEQNDNELFSSGTKEKIKAIDETIVQDVISP